MMPVTFPSEFPVLEIQQIIKYVTKKDTDIAKAALAGYGILGFAGFQAFGQPVLQLKDQVGPIVKDLANLEFEPTNEEMVALIAEMNDLFNLDESLMKGSLKGDRQIPDWILNLVMNILMNFFKRQLS